jgi:phenylacetate-CoA ligase
MRKFTGRDRLLFAGHLLVGITRSLVLKIMPEEFRRRERDRRFAALVHHAYNNVPFYRNKYDSHGVDINKISSLADISHLPTIDKGELQGKEHSLLSAKHSDSRDSLIATTTGGTSGVALTLFQSVRTVAGRVLSYHKAYSAMTGGYWPWYKLVYIYTGAHSISSVFGFYPLRYVSSLSPTAEMIDALVRERPHLIAIYPSILREVTSALSDRELRIIQGRLLAITTNSEASTQQERDALEQVWGVPVLDEFSSVEVPGVTASQCKQKMYHVDEDACFIEIESTGGTAGEGHLIVTSLLNWEMPLIRYNQGDSVQMSESARGCECGNSSLQLEAFTGRENDAFILESGRVLTTGFLLDVGYNTMLNYSDIIKYWSLIQTSRKEVTLECRFATDPDKETISSICSDVSAMLSDELEVTVRQVDEPRRTKAGKMKQIVSLVRA